MKIIRIPLQETQNSIECLEISDDNKYLTFQGPQNQIWVYKYSDFEKIIQYEYNPKINIEEKSKSKLSLDKKYWFYESLNINKIVIKEDRRIISCLRFMHTDSNFLFSSGFDKQIVIWKLITTNNKFDYNRIRSVPFRQEITEMKLFPDDKYLILGFLNGEISWWSIIKETCTFTNVGSFNVHELTINCIVLSPVVQTNGLFISLSEKGRLVLSKIEFIKEIGENNNIAKEKINFKNIKQFDFEDNDHYSKGDSKKIDWSFDNKFIISVDHHFIKNIKVNHARLIYTSTGKSEILIGHDSSPLIGKFSPCYYKNKTISTEEKFLLLVTADKNGDLKIWKLTDNKASLTIFNETFPDGIIKDIVFSLNGEYLFIITSFGSISIIVFQEFEKVDENYGNLLRIDQSINNNNIINNSSSNVRPKKVIVPTMISGFKPLISDEQENRQEGNILVNYDNNNNNNISNSISGNSIQNTNNLFNSSLGLACSLFGNQQMNPFMFLNQSQNFIQDQLYNIKNSEIPNTKREFIVETIKANDGSNFVISYENNIKENICTIITKFSNGYIMYAKEIKSLIKKFTYNNLFYAFYDTRNTLNVYTILNTRVYVDIPIEEVSMIKLNLSIEKKKYYVLVVTYTNKILIYDLIKNCNIINCDASSMLTNNFFTKERINEIYFIYLEYSIILVNSENLPPFYSSKRKIITINFSSKRHYLTNYEELTLKDKNLINEKENNPSIYSEYIKMLPINNFPVLGIKDYIDIDKEIENIFKDSDLFQNREDSIKTILKKLVELIINKPNFNFILEDFKRILELRNN